MSVNADVTDSSVERLLMAEAPDDFLERLRMIRRRFRNDFVENGDPKEFLSSSTRYGWKYFLLAYPLAALAMERVLKFFRQLEKQYLPIVEDEYTGELMHESEPIRDQLATPDQYFQKELAQDCHRTKSWTELLDGGDIHSFAWRRNCPSSMFTTSAVEGRLKLRDDLENQTEVIEAPWPKVIDSAVNEMCRRFDELEKYLGDFKILERIYTRKWQLEHPPGSLKRRRFL
jgi:hypothetical protein